MKIGTAQFEITPPPEVELGGFLFREQPATGLHDSLFARCLYLEHDVARLLWLHSDLLGLDARFVASFRAWAASHLGIEADQVLTSTTHTHSGPATVPMICCGERDQRYLQWLQEQCESAAVQAAARLERVSLVEAESLCDLAVDRRRKPSAHVDPRVGVLGFRRPDGTYAAVMANYAMHHVALGEGNRQFSGDVAGRAARRIADQLSGTPTVLLTVGAAGNLNPPRTGVDFAQVDSWGDMLANRVLAALRERTPAQDELRTAVARVDVSLHRPEPAWFDRIAEQATAQVAGRSGYGPARYRQAVRTWQERMQQRLAAKELPDSIPLELQAIRVGSTRLLCVNAEVFSLFADELRRAIPGRLYVIGYANGLIGYIPTEAAMDEGGYEVEHAFIFYDSLPVERGAFARLLAAGVELLQRVDARSPKGSFA